MWLMFVWEPGEHREQGCGNLAGRKSLPLNGRAGTVPTEFKLTR